MARAAGRMLPRNRANRMGNLYRTTNLIKLMAAAQRGLADEVAWAVRLRKFLEGYGGQMPLHSEAAQRPQGSPEPPPLRAGRLQPADEKPGEKGQDGTSSERG